jgi:hypothetical protein
MTKRRNSFGYEMSYEYWDLKEDKIIKPKDIFYIVFQLIIYLKIFIIVFIMNKIYLNLFSKFTILVSTTFKSF